jgi:hypothetical protein
VRKYHIAAYEGPDMKNYISNLEERMVVLTEEVKKALVKEEFGDSTDSADSANFVMGSDEDDGESESESDASTDE